jgi:exonuclease SbcC
MKPITLTVSGLHSFREKQVIDFESLCEGGVFGIFGPTGSGKSSILDAMTLALYGKVERASNNTQGIMNHAENILEVSYLFELENSQGKQRFKVERTFKRTDDIRVKSGICRLTEVKDEEHIVLADKSGDVNAAIQDIIGLTIDDFTRAVVLPQGKFAEFLSLKGADRRQMLQRLFQLEKYGDQLSRKIKEELQEKTRLLGEIHAEQLGLGEASDEAVKEADKAYKEIEKIVKSSETALQKYELIFEEKKKKWEWQKERQLVEQALQKIQEQETPIKALETRLSLIEQASGLKPLLDDLKEAEQALYKWNSQFEQNKASHQTAKELLEIAVKSYEAARKKKEEKQPVYLSRKEKLERAQTLEGGLTVHQEKLEELDQSIAKKKEKVSNIELQESKAKELYQKAIAKQKSLKEELALKSLAPGHIDQLQQAYERKQEILQTEKKHAETNVEVQKLHDKISQYHTENEKAKTNLHKVKESLVAIFHSTEKSYDRISDLTLQFDWLDRQVDQFLQDEKKFEENAKVHELALELAKSLKDGESCPVCGSTHHPGRAAHESLREVASSKEESGVEQLIPVIQQQRQENVKIKLKLEQLASELYRDLDGERSLPAPKNSFGKVDAWDKELNQAKDMTGLFAEKFHSMATEQKTIIQDLIQLQEKKAQLDLSLRKWSVSFHETEKLSQSYNEQWTDWNDRLQTTLKELDDKKRNWYETFTTQSYDNIDIEYKAAKELEKQRTELQERINKSVDFIETKEKEFKIAREMKMQEEKLLYQDNLIREQLLVRLKELQDEIKAIAGENSVVKELAHVLKAMEQLSNFEAEAYKTWTSSQQNYQECEKEATQSEQMVRETSARLKMLNDKWDLAFKQAAFTSKTEVEKSIQDIESKDIWKKQVQTYWEDRKATEKDLSRLNSLIGSISMEESEWLDFQEQLREARGKLREEIERKSALLQNLTSVKERNERYRTLEEKKLELTKETEAYQKLQAVFKGNSFVEYLAEEQLHQISRDASERLGQLTRQRYALEMDSQGGFIIRDDANGGVRRPVSSLSGGETFLTSLALALSLSAQIQLRGEYPLQFFFLDEGFGTLDSELLDAVVTALEKLQSNHLAVGVISHVQELRARLPRRLVVTPAQSSGKGSVVTLEDL